MKSFVYTFVFSLFLFTACGGDYDNPDPDTVANINGSVLLFTEGNALASTNSGMKVSVEGLGSQFSVLTDAAGKFVLENVPFGTYNLVYEKEGYGTFKRPGVEHKAGGTVLTDIPSLGQLSTTKVTDFKANPSGLSVQVIATTDPGGNSGNRRYVRFFFSTQSSVSSTNYQVFSSTFISQENPFGRVFTGNELAALGLTPGTVVFIRAYGDSVFSNSYVDPVTNKTVFPNLNPTSAPAVSVTIP
jgi:hypothetical protein